MKKITRNQAKSGIAGILIMVIFATQSCSKSSSSSAPPPPNPIGGFVSSDSVEPKSLIAYWPFDGDANDHKGSENATASPNVTYVQSGIRGQAYQGSATSYVTVPANASFASLQSYSISVWFNIAAQPSSSPNDPNGIFFLTGDSTQDELVCEIEPYKPVSGDSVRIHTGFNDLASPAYQLFVMEAFADTAIGKWVHLVMTYNGGTSTYTVYQDGVPINNNSAFGLHTSTQMFTDGSKTTPLGNLGFTDVPKQIILGTWPAGLFGVSPTLGSNGCYQGQMDELRVYNIELTQKDVSGLYLNGLAHR